MRSWSEAAEAGKVIAQPSIMATSRSRMVCLFSNGTRAEGPREPTPPEQRSFLSDSTTSARHAPDGAVVVVGHQQRPILHGKQIYRTPDIIVVLEEAGDEG